MVQSRALSFLPQKGQRRKARISPASIPAMPSRDAPISPDDSHGGASAGDRPTYASSAAAASAK